MRHLAKQHGHEWFPAGEPLGVELGLMLLADLSELSAWKKLRVYTAYLCHGLSSLLWPWLCLGADFRVTGSARNPTPQAA